MNKDEEIKALAEKLNGQTVAWRRDFHKYPETGYAEFRTAAIVYQQLARLGYQLTAFRDAVAENERMGVPAPEVLAEKQQRAVSEGAPQELVEQMTGGYTAVVATLQCGEGPTVGIRFDMDCVDVQESQSDKHFPCQQGFASVHPGEMHSCGHDGHTAIGLTIAEILVGIKDSLHGTVKLFFQPAEEGVRGARAIVAKGLCDGVDYMLGFHNMPGEVEFAAVNTYDFLATTKFDVIYKGEAAHAGTSPNCGKNALLAAVAAVGNMQAIARHQAGSSRINVGVLEAGTGRNVIPDRALLKVETRGSSSEINDYMRESAYRIARSAGAMHDVECQIIEQGSAVGVDNAGELGKQFAAVAERLGVYQKLKTAPERVGASDDISYYLSNVQQHGGKIGYYIYGADVKGRHHNGEYDFAEVSMKKAVIFLAAVISDIMADN